LHWLQIVFGPQARPEKNGIFYTVFILMADSPVNFRSRKREIKTINVIKWLVVDKVERTLYGQLSLEMRDVRVIFVQQ
jgi:hypothetical protein